MKKKIMVFVVAVLAACLFLVGCGETTYEPVKVSGKVEVVSGNGTFLVETSDYVYFINGEGTYTDDNGFGKVLKGSLVRTKKANLAAADAKGVDVIIPKLLITSSNETGVYVYGNYVYYASPCVEKSKNGTVRSGAVTFFKYNLNTGKNENEITTIDSYVAYKFVENNGKVYLGFTKSVTEDETTTNTYVCYDASKKDSLVYESKAYSSILAGDANTTTVYYTKAAYNETLEQDEKFYELYKYVIGSDSDTVVLGVTDTKNGKESFLGQASTQGYSLSLILNQAGYLIGTQTNLDSTYATVRYFAYNGTEFTDLGFANTTKDAAITSTATLKMNASEFDFYYVSSEKLICYTYAHGDEEKDVISNKVSGYTILDIDGNDIYLYGDSVIYTLDQSSYNSDIYRLNEITLDTTSQVFMPRFVSGNSTKYLVGIVTEEYGYKYPYALDIGTKTAWKLVDDDKDEVDSTKVKEYQKCLIGKVTDADKSSYDTYLENLIEAEEDED